MDDPDKYLVNEDPKTNPPCPPLCTVPWRAHQRFLTAVDGHGMGTLERWMSAPEEVHAIFHQLIAGGLDPWVGAALFCSTYCAPPGTYRVETSPDEDEEPDTARCSVATCPESFCIRHPSFTPCDVPGSSYDGERPTCAKNSWEPTL